MSSRRTAWVCLGLVALVLVAYGQVVHHEFVDFDDGAYIGGNPRVVRGLTWEGLYWAFATFHTGNWYPLTWLSHMLDVELFGLRPGPHHLVSVLLHGASSVLLLLALLRLHRAGRARSGAPAVDTFWPAALVAALFALHPLRVESVAWAAERKDVLSGLFWMLTMWAYARYAARPGRIRYGWVAASFVLGVLSKPMLVTLPAVLLLLDVWPLGRGSAGTGPRTGSIVPPAHLWLEKLPLVACAGAASVVALVAQRSAGAVGSLETLSLAARVGNAMVSYVAYLRQTLWPSGLAFYYPHAGLTEGADGTTSLVAFGAGSLLAAITVGCLAATRRRPWLAVGWLWYLGTLVPVIGLVQIGMQARADRYTYIPAIGLYLAVAWTVAGWASRSVAARRVAIACATLVVVACLATTWRQVGHWRDSRALAERALAVTERNYQAYNMLGVALQREGETDAALEAYRDALRIKPDYAECQINLATLLGDQGRLDEAASLFRLALRTNRAQSGLRAHTGLGAVFEKQGDLEGAADHLRRALELDPDHATARNNLGVLRLKQGRLDEARAELERAVRLSPTYAIARMNLGGVLQQLGDTEGAADQLREAVRLRPELVEARFKLGAVHAARGALDEAERQFTAVVEQAPGLAEAHYNLGVVLAEKGETSRAVAHLERAVALRPDYEGARSALDRLRGAGG
jgi:tetratricopeptide (TPR) repeat protein